MPRTMSTDDSTLHSTTLNSMSACDHMDPEVRAQILSNIQVIYEPQTAPQVHIATCRSLDGSFMAFLVMHGNLIKTVWNPNLLAGEARNSRAAALMSLLEATEDRIREMLLKSSANKDAMKKNPAPSAPTPTKKKVVPTLLEEDKSVDYGEKPKDKGFLSWRRSTRTDSLYASQT